MQQLARSLTLTLALLGLSVAAPLPAANKADLEPRTPTWVWEHAAADTDHSTGSTEKIRRDPSITWELYPTDETSQEKRDSGWGGKADVVTDGAQAANKRDSGWGGRANDGTDGTRVTK